MVLTLTTHKGEQDFAFTKEQALLVAKKMQETAARLFRAVGYFLNGAMLDETAGYTRGPSTVEPVPQNVMEREYPEVVAAGRWFAEPERQKTFGIGLKLLLDGIEQEISRATA